MASRAIQVTSRQRRTFLSYLFGLTAFASVLTVAASDVLPCPARSSTRRFAEGDVSIVGEGQEAGVYNEKRRAVVEKRPRRWIEEKRPPIASS